MSWTTGVKTCTFRVSTSSLSTEESMKTSLKWGQPCWPLRAFSCSLLSTELGSVPPSDPALSSSWDNSECLSGIFSAQGGLITGLTRTLCPFTTPHVNTAVISSSLSLAATQSTFKTEKFRWTFLWQFEHFISLESVHRKLSNILCLSKESHIKTKHWSDPP